jgi:hypothetical protein
MKQCRAPTSPDARRVMDQIRKYHCRPHLSIK